MFIHAWILPYWLSNPSFPLIVNPRKPIKERFVIAFWVRLDCDANIVGNIQ